MDIYLLYSGWHHDDRWLVCVSTSKETAEQIAEGLTGKPITQFSDGVCFGTYAFGSFDNEMSIEVERLY